MEENTTTPSTPVSDTTSETPKPAEELRLTKSEVDALLAKEVTGRDRTISEQAKRLKELENSRGDFRNEIGNLRNEVSQRIEMLAALVARGGSPQDLDDMDHEQKVDLQKEYQKLHADFTRKQAEEKLQQEVSTFQQRVEALGLEEEDPIRFADVYRLARSYDPVERKAADKIITRLEKAKASASESKEGNKVKEESVEEKAKKLAEEMVKKELESRGLLKTDTGSPSGDSGNDDEFIKQYSEGKSNDHKRAQKILSQL